MNDSAFSLPIGWPAPFDAAAADRLIERFRALGDVEARLLDTPGVMPMLLCLGGNSPYLAELTIREHETIRRVVADGPDAAFADVLSNLMHVSPDSNRPEIAAALRQAKRSVALIAAIADVGRLWPLESVTGALSDLAEATLRLAIRHLLRKAHDAREIRLQDASRPEANCGFTALAMGKLGAAELNYSSDIDLILIYDGTAPVYAAGSLVACLVDCCCSLVCCCII